MLQYTTKTGRKGREYLEDLLGKLSSYKTTNSAYFPDVSLYDLFNGVHFYEIKKESNRRQVTFIKTPSGNFFIKCSFLIRRKDQFRHFFLPRRRWAEWRNLHKLNALGVDSAKPVLRGQKFHKDLKSYFVITEEVEGKSLGTEVELNSRVIGQFFARIHERGIYCADLHPGNLIVRPNGRPSLIDVQEVFFLKKLPKWLRSYNLGKLYLSLRPKTNDRWFNEFLESYNERFGSDISIDELQKGSVKHYNKHIKSRTKRCLKNSSEFEVLKNKGETIYRRRGFDWTKEDIKNAIRNGVNLKENKVTAYGRFCIKIHDKGRFHKDRCLASWIASRELDVRGINVPKALGYFKFENRSFFVSEYLAEGIGLYEYLPGIVGKPDKRKIIKELACWVRKIHDHGIWQRDFNSTNVLCVKNQFMLIDLDNVKCGKLSERQKIYNLGQLNASIGDTLRLRDRIRFLYYYFSGEMPGRTKRREIYKKIWEITLTKNTLVFGLDTSKSNSFELPE